MKFINRQLNKKELKELQINYGNYLKLTIDIEHERVVTGNELHADGERLLLEKGSQQNDIWGGGIGLENKEIDTTAVLNLRPRLNNNGLEILDPKRREKFIKIVKKIFRNLWL